LSNLFPILEFCALRPSFFPNFASCICTLRPTYCIFSQIWMGFTLYTLRPTFKKSTPGHWNSCALLGAHHCSNLSCSFKTAQWCSLGLLVAPTPTLTTQQH
jgi:hypothetical protein